MSDKKIFVVTDAGTPVEVQAGGKKKADVKHSDMTQKQLQELIKSKKEKTS